MVLFPQLFHQAGWVPVVGTLILITLLSALCGYMVVEAMVLIPGNEKFNKRIEYTSLVDHYLPRSWYLVVQAFYQMALAAQSISMIIQSSQVLDFALAAAFGFSCAIPEFSPKIGVICPKPVPGEPTVFGDRYILPLGWIIAFALVGPLSFVSLGESVFVQKGAFWACIVILLVWLGIFFDQGLDGSRVAAWGTDLSGVMGTVIFNYTFITSIPSWVNEKQDGVPIIKTSMVGLWGSFAIFFLLGIFGALAFDPWGDGNTLLNVIYNTGTPIGQVTFYLFPVIINLLTIPVFSIMQRYNLVEGKVCRPWVANIIAVLVPWVAAVPLYTGTGYQILVNWAGIILNSAINFIVPPILYIVAVRRYGSRETKIDPKVALVPQWEKDAITKLLKAEIDKEVDDEVDGEREEPYEEPEENDDSFETVGLLNWPQGHRKIAPLESSTQENSTTMTKAEKAERRAAEHVKVSLGVDAMRHMTFPESQLFYRRAWYVVTLPWRLLVHYTTPDNTTSRWRRWWPLSLTISFAGVGASTYVVMFLAHRMGVATGIHPFYMGFFFVAAALKIPDIVFMADRVLKKQSPTLSISNVVSDLCFGLGLPWLLYILVHGGSIQVQHDSVPVLFLLLFIMISLVMLALQSNSWRLGAYAVRGLALLFLGFVIATIFVFHSGSNCASA